MLTEQLEQITGIIIAYRDQQRALGEIVKAEAADEILTAINQDESARLNRLFGALYAAGGETI